MSTKGRYTARDVIGRVIDVSLFVIAILMILLLTLQNGTDSASLTTGFQAFCIRVAGLLGLDTANPELNSFYLFRKIGHLIEYFILGLFCGNYLRNHRIWWSLGTCAVISFLDQTLKNYLPGREFDPTDFPFDIAGYVIGIVLIRGIRSHLKDS